MTRQPLEVGIAGPPVTFYSTSFCYNVSEMLEDLVLFMSVSLW